MIRLDHTIVPAKDKVASAEFFAEIFGLTVKPGQGHFAQVQVNESLTFDFADEPEPWGGQVSTPGGPEPSLRLPCQRGGVRVDLRPGESQGARLRQWAVQPHRRPDLHPPGRAWLLFRGPLRPSAGSHDSARDGELKGNGMARRPSKQPESFDAPPPSSEWGALRTLTPYLWEFPARVVLAIVCLVLAKLAGVALPLVLKHIVDRLETGTEAVAVVPLALLAAYGALRFANVLFGELREVVFGRVTERAVRRAALNVFRHLHALDLGFHLSRRTGGLSRDIERGVSGISFLLRFSLFNIVPTLIELAMVAVILYAGFAAEFATLALGSVVLYVAFSVWVTEWRTKHVREANRLDSHAKPTPWTAC